MRTVLAIAGCGPRLEVALAHSTLPAPALVALPGPAPRSDVIIEAMDLLLRATALTPDQLDLVVATRGPGSFTGLRVALATAQGLVLARGIAGHGFSSLAAQAARTRIRPCVAVAPARRGFFYAHTFAGPAGLYEEAPRPAVIAAGELAGVGVGVVAPAGLELPADVPLVAAVFSTAEALLELSRHLETPDAATLVPMYVEPPQVSPPRPSIPTWPLSRRVS